METITDCFGEVCEVLDRCGRCNAPRYQRPGETGTSQIHTGGCHLNQGSWHVDARCEMEQAKARDSAQIEHRVKEYGGNVGTPAGYQGARRAPSKTGVTE